MTLNTPEDIYIFLLNINIPSVFSSLQNVVPVLDGPVEGPSNPEQQLHEQEKRIEISCALAAEASRRSRLLSGEEACCPEEPGRAVTPNCLTTV